MISVESFNQLLFLFSAVVLLLISFSNLLQRLWMPLPLPALIFGVIIGPEAGAWLDIPGAQTRNLVLEEAARLTLAVGLMGVALRLPKQFWRRQTRFIVVILALAMPLMWAVGTLLSVWWLGLPLWSALLVSAILTPTDPIVSTPIVSGEIADKELPPWVQQGISAESGANDGLGFIFVALPVYILTMGGHDAWTHWLVHGWLWELGVAAIVGIASGWLAGKLLNWDVQHNEIERTGYLGFTLALPIVVMTLTRLLEADGILAAFLAGVVLDQLISDDHQEHQEEIQEAINKFLTVTIFMLLGAFLPWKEWAELGWDTAAALAGILILRRAITIVLIRRILRPSMRRDETLFLSWFAPIGIAALYYVVWAEDQTGDRSLWPIISLAITLSVVLHGITATPFSRWLGREEHAR